MLRIIIYGLVLVFMAQTAYGDLCPLARELARTGIETFQKDRKKGLAALIQAHKYCPQDLKISFNLGLAYYKYRRPDLAYKVWKEAARKHKQDFQLINNLAWLALELGRLEESTKWAENARKLRPEDKELASLMMEIMFKQGRYEVALKFARKNRLQKRDVQQAAEYLAEKVWNRFRRGEKEEAVQEMIALSRKYPDVSMFGRTKDRMVLAFMDDSADIPLPKPLPDEQFRAGQGQVLVGPVGPGSEALDLRRLKQTLKPDRNAYALIVGIRRYKQIKGPRFAENDARQMYRLLVKRCGFCDDIHHIKLRINSDATLGTLYDDLEWLCRKAKLNPQAKIFFYFSGHGSPVLQGQNIMDGLLVPYEASLDGLSDRTAISLNYLREKFGQLKNKNLVCVLDACFTGTGKSVCGKKLIRPRINESLLASNKLFICASAANRAAEEYAPGQQGAFSYFFLKALLGEGDKNKDNWVDTLEAFTYAKEKLDALELEQNPQISIKKGIRLARY